MNTMIFSATVLAGVLIAALGFGLAAALLWLVSTLTGLYGAKLFKDLRRVYHLHVIGYWLDRLEKGGVRVFERAEQLDQYYKSLKRTETADERTPDSHTGKNASPPCKP